MTRRRRHNTGLPAGMIQALAALYGGAPLSDDERAEHRAKIAAQRSKDEAKASPQGDLLHVEPAE